MSLPRPLVAACLALACLAAAPATRPSARVEGLMGKLTLDEKIRMLAGVDTFYAPGTPRLGIPRLRMTDGPNGTRVFGKSTAYPAGVLLAATWDPALARREGEQLGRDALARDCQVLLGPGMNLQRNPQNGRNFEYFSEDPLLTGRIAAGYVRGVQSQGVSAVLKHFVANNQETDRYEVNVEADERTLRELYLRGFHWAIEGSRPGAVMCSYNRLNGPYAAADRWLLNDVLRDEWGFEGIVMSDWGAVHSTLGPLRAGLDLEMPGPEWLNGERIKPLLGNGVITQEAIDSKVRRQLVWMDRFGWLDGKPTADRGKGIPLDNPQGVAVALDVARAGLTLLKNEGGLLPLDKSTVKKIVVLGPGARDTPVGGGGSGYTTPFHSVSVLAGLQKSLGADRVVYLPGDPFLKLAMGPAVDGKFSAEFFANPRLEGEPKVRREVATVGFDSRSTPNAAPVEGMPTGPFSARYHATITPDKAAEYTFFTVSDDGSRVLLDGKAILDDWSEHQARRRTATAKLEAGRKHELVVEYYDSGGEASLRFGCGPLPPAYDDAERAALRAADAAVVCVGFGPAAEAEGGDRPYALPEGQADLILSAAAVNPRTVVLLSAGGGVETAPWIGKVAGLLHAFYAGQEGGTAVAEVLTGAVNPSGHLPFSFAKKLAAVPSQPYWGTPKVAAYAEGLFMGYRGFDQKGSEPLFPFGYGLSYTTFSLGAATAKVDGDAVVVTAEVSNTGGRAGAAVVQCYAEPPKSELPRPARELRAFAKVPLAAGEKKSVELRIPKADLAYWNPATRAWTVTPGTYRFRVGFDERDLPQTAKAEVR